MHIVELLIVGDIDMLFMLLITPKPANVLEPWTFTHCIICVCVECSFLFRIHLEVGALDKNVRKGGHHQLHLARVEFEGAFVEWAKVSGL